MHPQHTVIFNDVGMYGTPSIQIRISCGKLKKYGNCPMAPLMGPGYIYGQLVRYA